MIDRALSLLVAVSLALLVWLYARSRDQEILDNVPIPVHIALPPGHADQYSLEINGPSEVPVAFSGPPNRIRELRGMLQRGEISVHVTLTVPEEPPDEARYLDRYLDTVRIDVGDLHVPPGITPMVLDGRNRIPVTLYRLVERRLPVQCDPALREGNGRVTLEPATVLVRGPQEVLDRVRAIPTQPFALPPQPEGASAARVSVGPVPLVTEIDGRPVRTTPGAVMVRVTPQPKVYEVEAPIQFLCPPDFPLRPKFIGDGRAGKVSLKVLGPAQDEPPAVFAFVDLTRAGGKFEPGNNLEPLRIQLPRDFQLAQDPPRMVAFELLPTDVASPRGAGVVSGP